RSWRRASARSGVLLPASPAHSRGTDGAPLASYTIRRMPPSSLLSLLRALTPPPQPTPAPKPEPFAILDNSFLVEEAFNQEAHIFQNIFGAVRQAGAWQMTFTQEWPAPSIRHQLSYTIGAQGAASA